MLFSKYHLITSLIKGKNSACTLPMCVMKSVSRIIHVMICLKQYWQLKTLITILSQYTHSDTHGLMNRSHSTQGKTCQQVYSRGHRQDVVWLKLCTSTSMFIVHQSVWNICTHTAYNVHKTHNKSLSSRNINISGGGENPCLSSWSMTLQDAHGDSGVCALLLGTASDVRAGCRDSLASSRGCRLPIGRICHWCASLAQISNHIYRPINHTIKSHTLIKDMQYWQFMLVNTLAYSEARFKHSTKYNVSSPYHAGSWHCRQQLPWQPDPRARGFDDSSFPGSGKYMNWTHV